MLFPSAALRFSVIVLPPLELNCLCVIYANLLKAASMSIIYSIKNSAPPIRSPVFTDATLRTASPLSMSIENFQWQDSASGCTAGKWLGYAKSEAAAPSPAMNGANGIANGMSSGATSRSASFGGFGADFGADFGASFASSCVAACLDSDCRET